MRVTRLRGGNSQFPEAKATGDVVVLALGDMFCWDGRIWQLLGGRFVPAAIRDRFLAYVASDWPDSASALFDLPKLLSLDGFAEYACYDTVPADPKWISKLISRVAEVAEGCEKNKKEGLEALSSTSATAS